MLEALLSHAIENETEAAYVRTNHFEERHLIMRRWADYLDAVKVGAQVIPFNLLFLDPLGIAGIA